MFLLLWFAMLWAGIFLGLSAKGPEAVTAVQILVWPAGFLSSVFADPPTMPVWLGTAAEWNPMSAAVTASREWFMNPGFAGKGVLGGTPRGFAGGGMACSPDGCVPAALGQTLPAARPVSGCSLSKLVDVCYR